LRSQRPVAINGAVAFGSNHRNNRFKTASAIVSLVSKSTIENEVA